MSVAIFRKGLFGLVILFTALNTVASTSVGCNDSYVSMNNAKLIIEVAPTNSDDTENLQCALDAATQLGVPIVRLGAADYYISNIIAENFNGTLQGRSISTTRLLVQDYSIDCQGLNDQNRSSAALKFVKGRPRLHALQIFANESCQDGQILRSIVHFTGAPASTSNCESDLIFGVVDRVDVQGGSNLETSPRSAVIVRAEGRWFPEACNTTLVGAFSMRKSRAENTIFGVHTVMSGGAQVDISFNQFQSNFYSISMRNANQNTMISNNNISTAVPSVFGSGPMGIYAIAVGENAPGRNSVVVKKNRIEISSDQVFGVGVFLGLYEGAKRNIDALVIDNEFLMALGPSVVGSDISYAHISGNTIRHWLISYSAITVSGERRATGWTITNNTGYIEGAVGPLPLSVYIHLGEVTKSNIVGPKQNFSVGDLGVDNYIIHPTTYGAQAQVLSEQSVNKSGAAIRAPREILP